MDLVDLKLELESKVFSDGRRRKVLERWLSLGSVVIASIRASSSPAPSKRLTALKDTLDGLRIP
jgi:hypothetical protein